MNGRVDVDIDAIAYDSRAVLPGTLFVALPSVSRGTGDEGAEYARHAVERGAVAIVAESPPNFSHVTTVRVTNARAALADLAATFYGWPSQQLCIFAVTGTDGKTTTTYLLEQILAHAGRETGLIGTVETKIGKTRRQNLERMTTPESLDLQRLLRHMLDANVTHVALEASSHALVLDRLRACTLSVVGVTNVTSDHIEFHGSSDAYVSAKALLFNSLGRGCPAVLNRDDASFSRLLEETSGPVTTYGLHPAADVRASTVRSDAHGSTFVMHSGTDEKRISLPLPGRFNILNALAASALAMSGGVDVDTVVDALSHAQAPPGRMQRIAGATSFNVFIDYAHTMNAFETVLATLREQTPSPHKLIAVFGATGNRDRAKRPVLARVARRYTDYFFITNEDPYGEIPGTIIDQVAAGVSPSERGVRFEQEPDRGRAIERAIAGARPGDTVVILGKGHEQSMVVEDRKEPWSDVIAAQHALEKCH